LETLQNEAPVSNAEEIPALPQAPASDRHLIILAPQPNASVTGSRVEAFAAAAGLAPCDARLALLTQRHRLLRKVADAQEASELSKRIGELEVVHFNLAEAEVEALQVVRVRWMRFHSDHLELGLAGEKPARIGNSELCLLVQGEISRSRHQEQHMATTHGASKRLTPEHRLHLCAVDASVAVELDPEQFDWSVLGADRSNSTPINFKRFVDEILGRTEGLELDRGFDLEPVVLSRSESDAEIDAMLGAGQKDREGAIYDNEDQFRFYARWRYLVELVARQARPPAGSR
jgi:hypothetical protein